MRFASISDLRRARSQALRPERLQNNIHHDRRRFDVARSSSLSYWSSSLSSQGWFCQIINIIILIIISITPGVVLPDHHHYHIDHHLYHRRGWFCQSLFWWAWVLAVWVDRRKGGKVKPCSLIIIISSQAMFSNHHLIFIGTNTVWSTYHDGILISQVSYHHHIFIGKHPVIKPP